MRHIAFGFLAAELLGSPTRTQVPLAFSKKSTVFLCVLGALGGEFRFPVE
jgi:hypothetical protein